MSKHAFTARVETVSMGVPFYVVVVPATVSAALGPGRVHVVGTVNGTPLQTSLTPTSSGRHKLFLNRRVREAAKVAPGDRVKIVLERDVAPKQEPVPDDLAHALRDADVLGPFERIARSTRNELIRWIRTPGRSRRARSGLLAPWSAGSRRARERSTARPG